MTDQLNPLWYQLPALFFLLFIWFVAPRLVKRFQKGRPVNPVAEARVYLAYGRKEQAANVLKEALKADPANAELLAELKKVEEK